MQTYFTLAQLADPDIAESEKILRACVHCGFCNATCPTYVLDGNELDSPRGRIYLIKDMLENDRPATAEVDPHRSLSVLPRLHDDLPVRGALHAPRRPCPRPYRTNLSPAAEGTGPARDARQSDAVSAPFQFAARCGAGRQTIHAACRRRDSSGFRPCCAYRRGAGRTAAVGADDTGRGPAPAKDAWRCSPAASTTCWRLKSMPPQSAFSHATASRW